jgi:hypothetical protein
LAGVKNQKHPKGLKRKQRFKTTQCSTCNKDILMIRINKNPELIKCWECSLEQLKIHRRERKALNTLYENAI